MVQGETVVCFALWCVFIVIKCTVVRLFLSWLNGAGGRLQCQIVQGEPPRCGRGERRARWLMGEFVWCCQPFVSLAFEVIDTSCFHPHKSSPLQRLAQNKSWRLGTCCGGCESPHQREEEEPRCLGFRQDFSEVLVVTADMEMFQVDSW